jgi:adenine specific DNA methylase Mod
MNCRLDRELYTVLIHFIISKVFLIVQLPYLTTMAIRIWYMHKLLKDTGSFYLHCNHTMSHYLKLLCDMIFGDRNYRNEITWRRTGSHNDTKEGRIGFGNVADIILVYSKSNKAKFNHDLTGPGKSVSKGLFD